METTTTEAEMKAFYKQKYSLYKDYHTVYYEKNKDYWKEKGREQVWCEPCQKHVKKQTRRRHERTLAHQQNAGLITGTGCTCGCPKNI